MCSYVGLLVVFKNLFNRVEKYKLSDINTKKYLQKKKKKEIEENARKEILRAVAEGVKYFVVRYSACSLHYYIFTRTKKGKKRNTRSVES